MNAPQKAFLLTMIEALEKMNEELKQEGYIPTIDLLVEKLKEEIKKRET